MRSILSFILLASIFSAQAHEYWLDPIDTSIKPGDSVIVDVRNGEDFTGSAFPFDANRFASVVVSNKNQTDTYKGRLGDYPALHPELNEPGIHSISLETNATSLTYDTWEKFSGFLEYHGLDSIQARHVERELPLLDITERYFRSAKTIVQVNKTGELQLDDTQAIDIENHQAFTPKGSLFEMVLLDNPYSSTQSVRIKLLFDASPLANRQVEMFWKGSTQLRFTGTTNSAGIAEFKLLGEGDYLLNAVQVLEPIDNDVHWLSYWASMTFER